VAIDGRTGEINGIQTSTASAISEEDAEDAAENNPVIREFFEDHPDSELWASYHGTSGDWTVTVYDNENMEKVVVLVDGQTAQIVINTPGLDTGQVLQEAKSRPSVDNFLRLYAEESRARIKYDSMLDQWIVSFVNTKGDSATVNIDDTGGLVLKVRMFSWEEAIERFEEVMGD
jgi:hypothetical protein